MRSAFPPYGSYGLAKLPPVDWPPFEVKELTLFQSVLSAQGSKYTPLKMIPLG